MKHIILAAIGFWIIINYPHVLVGAAVTIGLLLYLGRDDVDILGSLRNKGQSEKDSTDPANKELYGEFIKDGVVDWAGYNESQVDKMMKDDFRNDPEWQKKSAEIREHMRKAVIESERELQKDINEELKENEGDFWTKTR